MQWDVVAKEQSEDKTIKPLIAVRLCEYLEKKRKLLGNYSRVHISLDKAFFKIL